ncbi:hypothetical protein [Rhodothermus profundi]|uniref:Uncharacterized protein n=1 Tax=Rhodothermus profundi TaxID=633813 RepID=A0A1M6PDI4_9BACT|nr:hypothetical protein [Rhodothermus profundi]SHK06028.1 hypothetical protein SAMN04488087_0140 [Rhodothermus profundi]
MKLSASESVAPVAWGFLEEVSVLCLLFAAQSERRTDPEVWLKRLAPEASASHRKAALEAAQTLFRAGCGMALVTWVLEDRAPRWSRQQRRHVLQVLTEWAVACGAPPLQLRVLVQLEQVEQRRRRRAGRYGDRPPR